MFSGAFTWSVRCSRRWFARRAPDQLRPDAPLGGIRYAGGDTDDVTYVPGQTSTREEMFYLYMTHDEGWPEDSEVTVEQVRQAVREFIDGNGSRPRSFEWREWPQGVR
jgi:hypothetical protein